MKTWTVMIYHWNGTAYSAEPHTFFNEELARRVFTAMELSGDIQQIDLYEDGTRNPLKAKKERTCANGM